MHQIVISALGEDKPGIVKSVSKFIYDCGGNIAESHMSILGGEFALMMLVSGDDATLDKISSDIDTMAASLNLTTLVKRTASLTSDQKSRPYRVEIIAMDHPGIVHDVTDYLERFGINVQELETDCYAAPHTGTPMFALTIEMAIPASVNISEFKAGLNEFCDDMNLDVSLEAS